jgi:hypothetical protein
VLCMFTEVSALLQQSRLQEADQKHVVMMHRALAPWTLLWDRKDTKSFAIGAHLCVWIVVSSLLSVFQRV